MCFYAHGHTYVKINIQFSPPFQKKKNQILSTHLIFGMVLRISEKDSKGIFRLYIILYSINSMHCYLQ